MLSITPAPEKMTRFTHMVEASILEVAAAGLIIADKNKTGESLHRRYRRSVVDFCNSPLAYRGLVRIYGPVYPYPAMYE